MSEAPARLLAEIKAFGPELAEIWTPRHEAAIERAREAANAWFGFVDDNYLGLLREIRPHAERVTRQYLAEQKAVEQKLSKLRTEHVRIAETVKHIVSGQPELAASGISLDPSVVPLP